MLVFRLFVFLLCLLPCVSVAQTNMATVSGLVREGKTKGPLPFVNLILKKSKDSAFVMGTITDEAGHFVLKDVASGTYILESTYLGYASKFQEIVVGSLNRFLDLGTIDLNENTHTLSEVTVTAGQPEGVSERMDKKTFAVSDNISQTGGSVLQAMQNLPGVTVQEGKVQLRGSDKVAVLIDGKQNAITGFGTQTGLDNIPASAIDRIEIINNPSSKYDANGNAGIINIIYKKSRQEGWNGKVGLTAGLGALWVRKENLPSIRPQYQRTPKVNPSLSLNYRKNKLNTFLQADWLYTETLNRNEFSDRVYTDGTIIKQQVKRNRNTSFSTAKTGIDWNPDEQNTVTLSGYFNRERILDHGDIPYFTGDLAYRLRLWQFLEDEVKYTATASAVYQHKFAQPGHLLNASFNYTFHREDEKYFFTNIMPAFTGKDSFALLSDEHVGDLNIDYVKPLPRGRLESGLKFRRRYIPTNMQFFPGLNSPLDVRAGGWANYSETIPAVYGNYVLETKKIELEGGIRFEYVKVDYEVNPNHPTYKSDGYTYGQPFPNVRFAYKLNDRNKFSLFFNRRVDRPNEVDIRIFPKYDEPEVIKVGNPTLRPQFTNNYELGYKTNWSYGSFYAALFHRMSNATITRIATTVPGSLLIYNIFQNAGKSSVSGLEITFQKQVSPKFSFNVNSSFYRNIINTFQVENRYPVPTLYTIPEQSITSGNVKFNGMLKLPRVLEVQLTAIYLAPDIIPQGRVESRFSVDMGLRKQIQKGRGELFLNGTDIFNTLVVRRKITGNNFVLTSADYLETQVFRAGYSYKF